MMYASAIVVGILPVLAMGISTAVVQKIEQSHSITSGPWKDGNVYYNVDLYITTQPNLLMHLVKLGLEFIEERSCLKFRNKSPSTMQSNLTFLNFAFTGVYENCCKQHYEYNFYGKRMVVLSPRCNDPHEVAHAILHAMGLTHKPGTPFPLGAMIQALFPIRCEDIRRKLHKFTTSVAKQGNYRDLSVGT